MVVCACFTNFTMTMKWKVNECIAISLTYTTIVWRKFPINSFKVHYFDCKLKETLIPLLILLLCITREGGKALAHVFTFPFFYEMSKLLETLSGLLLSRDFNPQLGRYQMPKVAQRIWYRRSATVRPREKSTSLSSIEIIKESLNAAGNSIKN